MKAKKHLCKKVEAVLEVLSQGDSETKLNLTDLDVRIMRGKKGNFDAFYNVQVGCSEDQIISYTDVVIQGNDRAQLIPAIQGIQSNTGQKVEQVLADSDYGTFESFEYLEQQNICGYVPYSTMNAIYADRPYHKVHFIYEAEKDAYRCPANQMLTFKTIRKVKRPKLVYRRYSTKACLNCPFRAKCCSKKAKSRIIEREVREQLREQMKQRLNSPEGKKIYLRRLHPVEAIFGHLKYNLGYTQFLLRGLEKVKAEFQLMCLAYNLGKLARYKKLDSAHLTRLRAFKVTYQACTALFLKLANYQSENISITRLKGLNLVA